MNNKVISLQEAKGRTEDTSVVVAMLQQVTDSIYFDRQDPMIRDLADADFGLGIKILNREEFFGVKTNQIRLGFAGGCDPLLINRAAQKQAMFQISGYKLLMQQTSAFVHGGTLWGMIMDAHLAAKQNGKLSIGVMPLDGIPCLLQIREQLGSDFPRMDKLAISGRTWTDHTTLFAQSLDQLILTGGRDGALAEAKAVYNERLLGKKKDIVCLLLNEQDKVFKQFDKGQLYTKSADKINKYAQQNWLSRYLWSLGLFSTLNLLSVNEPCIRNASYATK